jgi:hypothetical protein
MTTISRVIPIGSKKTSPRHVRFSAPLTVPLPHGFDIDQYGIMRRFAETVANPLLRQDLLDSIGGRGTFRRFKDMALRHGILDDYHRFHDGELADLAAHWLDDHQIEYRR